MIAAVFPFALSAVLLALAGAPAEATLRKCGISQTSDPTFDPDRVMVMINGEPMGQVAGGTPGVAYIDGDVIRAIPSSEIVEIRIACLQLVTDSEPVMTQVISVVTRRGAERVARRFLRELDAEQETFRASRGRFAHDFNELQFFAQRVSLPIALQASDTRWMASISQGDVTCRSGAGVGVGRGVECVDASGKVLGGAYDRSSIASRLRASPF